MSVRIAFLGGLGEIGRNCATIEIDGRIAVVDCGLAFPEDHMLGIDLILPDFASVLERADDIECIVLTHGHEDHVGALGYLLKDVSAPVYGTALTVGLAANRVEEHGVDATLHAVDLGEEVRAGPFRFTLIQVSHSIPQGAAVAFDTPEGIVLHTGDFKLDPTPIDALPTDLPALAEMGRRGVRLMLSDSTNAEREGFVPSESTIGSAIYELVVEAEGRVVAACFASHIHRVQQIVDAAVDAGRSFALLGRSMERNSVIAGDLGMLRYPEDSRLELKELLELPPEDTAIISTGSQGEPFAALSLMAAGEHRGVQLEPGDTVIISATPIPGNETRVGRVINGLLRRGVNVYHGRNAPVHVSGHGARDELRTMVNVVRPQALIPVHGEFRHLRAHAQLAEEMGVPEVVICEDGDAVVLSAGKLYVNRDEVPAGYVFVDGGEIGDVDGGVLRDRRHLADDGVVVVTVGIDGHSGDLLVGPTLDSHGLAEDPSAVLKMAAAEVAAALAELNKPVEVDTVRRRVRETAVHVIRRETGRRPVVFPVVLEV